MKRRSWNRAGMALGRFISRPSSDSGVIACSTVVAGEKLKTPLSNVPYQLDGGIVGADGRRVGQVFEVPFQEGKAIVDAYRQQAAAAA